MTQQSTCKGISFPFRIGNRGGVVMSEVNNISVAHIEESIEQILLTYKGERPMEYYFGSELDIAIFEPNEISTHNLIKYQIVEALNQHEPRITIDKESITLSDDPINKGIIVNLDYVINEYQSSHRYTTRLGGDTNEA